MRYTIQILKLLFVTCVWKVEGNAFLKRRLSTLEMRVNVIDQHIEALNTSLVTLEDQMCQNIKDEGDEEIKHTSGQSDASGQSGDVSRSIETIIRKGLVDEKQWTRKEMRIIKNDMRTVENQVESNSDTVEEIVTRMHVMVNDFDRKLDAAISEVMANCNDEIRKRDEKLNEQHREIDNLKQIVNKTVMDNLKQIVNKTEIDKLKQIVNKTKTDSLKQIVNITEIRKSGDEVKEVSSCPNGWTTFQSFCYLYVKENKTYVSARETCLNLGASVADIQSSSENDFVYKLCEDNGHTWTSTGNVGTVWIGITDEETEGVWIVERTGEKGTYMNWRSYQPDGSWEQNCLFMGYDTPFDLWNDWRCDSSRHKAKFVCKRKL